MSANNEYKLVHKAGKARAGTILENDINSLGL